MPGESDQVRGAHFLVRGWRFGPQEGWKKKMPESSSAGAQIKDLAVLNRSMLSVLPEAKRNGW